MKYDLHTHSKYSSDGYMDPELLVKVAIKKGLSGVAITDHNTLKGGLKSKEYENDDFKVIVGCEINTDRGEVTGLFLSREIESNTFPDVVGEIKDQNGLVILPHPFDELRDNGLYPQKEDAKVVDLVEVFNSRCLLQRYNDKALEFAVENSLKFAAGSDAHFSNEIGKAGVITNEENIRESLIKDQIGIYGARSNFINLGLTKMLKTWRKQFKG